MGKYLTFTSSSSFLSEFHYERYLSLVCADSTEEWDIERQTFFYIIAGNPVLYDIHEKIYDFENHYLKSNVLRSTKGLCPGEGILLRIAINLYNGNAFRNIDPWYIMIHLDIENRLLALNSIRLRFHI